MKHKPERIHIRAEDDLKERLRAAAEVVGEPASKIVRDAVNEKLAKLARRYPQLQTAEAR
ncbi:MAG TPA: hypothetical protein VF297_05025 [Pyrinomonadaceae bacterium]